MTHEVPILAGEELDQRELALVRVPVTSYPIHGHTCFEILIYEPFVGEITVNGTKKDAQIPTAILLSRFTTDYRALLLGVNIGGTGTLIASLASLITFSEFRVLYPGHGKQYFWMFTGINAGFLVVMTVAAKLFFL